LQASFAKWEKAEIRQRFLKGKSGASRAGAVISGTARFGYQFELPPEWRKPSDKRPVLDKDEAEPMRIIFRLIAGDGKRPSLSTWAAAGHLSDTLRIPNPTDWRIPRAA